VSGGEIFRALKAGVTPEKIVIAGVGKTRADLSYAVEQRIAWFNAESLDELEMLDEISAQVGVQSRVALRLNPNITAKTIPHIATGHGGAKFGLSADVIIKVLDHPTRYPHLRFEGIHVHIGSQLNEVQETVEAVYIALNLVKPYPEIHTIDIGGGFPVAYQVGDDLPHPYHFAEALSPLLQGWNVMIEPGRSIIADAGILISEVLSIKTQGDQTFVIVDAGMTELIRPMLYGAHHAILPVTRREGAGIGAQVVGPVCESTDVFAQEVELPPVQRGDLLAIMTAGAYGFVMASNYNARPRPMEVVVSADGTRWEIARRRETWDDLVALE
jgi:diaminopimelate decarboxylase